MEVWKMYRKSVEKHRWKCGKSTARAWKNSIESVENQPLPQNFMNSISTEICHKEQVVEGLPNIYIYIYYVFDLLPLPGQLTLKVFACQWNWRTFCVEEVL